MDELKRLYAAYADKLQAGAYARAGDYAHLVFGEGAQDARWMLIGEAPGREEAEAGRPFVGKAGRELDAMLQTAGVLRASAYVTNAVKFRPIKGGGSVANRTPVGAECREALPVLAREIELLHPRLIATLGNTPLRSILWLAGEQADTVGALHGRARTVRIGEMGCVLFPLYHPASIIYTPALAPVLQADLCCLGEILREMEAHSCENL